MAQDGNESSTEFAIRMLDYETVSPVTLSTEWSRVARLLIMAGLSVIGSVGNGYMISAVIVEEHLSKRGNSYIANLALADLLISGIVIPASAVIILAGLDDFPPVCHMQWFLAVLCCLVAILTMLAIAAENYIRLCLSPDCYTRLTSSRITFSILFMWGLSTLLVSVQFFYKSVPNYCAKKITQIVPYQALVAGLFVVVPIIVTVVLYLKINYRVRVARANPSFKPPLVFNWDYSLMLTNLYSFVMFIIFWLPFWIILAISSVKVVSAHLFYKLAWLSLSRSCFNNILYCITNRHFQNAYVNLFHYCCCKTTVTFSRRTRGEGSRPSGDVRVHIIPGYNVYPYTSPQRGADPPKKCGGGGGGGGKRYNGRHCNRSRQNGREVYQL